MGRASERGREAPGGGRARAPAAHPRVPGTAPTLTPCMCMPCSPRQGPPGQGESRQVLWAGVGRRAAGPGRLPPVAQARPLQHPLQRRAGAGGPGRPRRPLLAAHRAPGARALLVHWRGGGLGGPPPPVAGGGALHKGCSEAARQQPATAAQAGRQERACRTACLQRAQRAVPPLAAAPTMPAPPLAACWAHLPPARWRQVTDQVMQRAVSKLYENEIGKGRPFASYLFPLLQRAFPEVGRPAGWAAGSCSRRRLLPAPETNAGRRAGPTAQWPRAPCAQRPPCWAHTLKQPTPAAWRS